MLSWLYEDWNGCMEFQILFALLFDDKYFHLYL